MSFRFSGIFARADAEVLDALQKEFGDLGKMILSPLVGLAYPVGQAIAIPADDDPESNASAEQLIAFSRGFPSVTFVYVYAECFGGVCEYAGFVFRDGQRIHDELFRDRVGDLSPLKRLVSFLDVELGAGGYFAPLSRDFFFRSSSTPSGLAVEPTERVRQLSEMLARAWEPAPADRRKSTFWNRLFGGRPKAG